VRVELLREFDPLDRYPSILERDSVGRQDHETATRECWSEGLPRVAHVARYFTLAQVKLTAMLMVDDHPTDRLAMCRREQEGGDDVIFKSAVFDPYSVVPVCGFALTSPVFHLNGVRES